MTSLTSVQFFDGIWGAFRKDFRRAPWLFLAVNAPAPLVGLGFSFWNSQHEYELLTKLNFILAELAIVGPLSFISLGLTTYALDRSTAEGDISGAQLLSRVRERFWLAVGAAVRADLFVFLGYLALFFPGVIVWVWYLFTAPAVMTEDEVSSAAGATARSKFLARPYFWELLVLMITILFVQWVAGRGMAWLFGYSLSWWKASDWPVNLYSSPLTLFFTTANALILSRVFLKLRAHPTVLA